MTGAQTWFAEVLLVNNKYHHGRKYPAAWKTTEVDDVFRTARIKQELKSKCATDTKHWAYTANPEHLGEYGVVDSRALIPKPSALNPHSKMLLGVFLNPSPLPIAKFLIPIGSIVVPFGELPYRIVNMSPKKELLWSLWVVPLKELPVVKLLNLTHDVPHSRIATPKP